jgi:hypothetical protein
MTYVRMEDFRPPPSDDQPWVSMQIRESADGVSALGAPIESKSLIIGPGITPVGLDVDPRYPVARDWTTEFATLPPGSGYYSVRFTDADGNQSNWSDWVYSAVMPWVPSLRDVAVHIRPRTVERSTNKFLGTFTNKTRPTDEETWEAVALAIDDIVADTGKLDRTGISIDSHRAVRALTALRAAMIIERSFYSEQIGTNKSPYPALERDWERRLPKIVDAIAEDLVGEIEPTVDYGGSDGGVVPTPNPTTDSDLIVPGGSRVLTKAGVWVGSGTAQYTPGEDDPNNIDFNTRF